MTTKEKPTLASKHSEILIHMLGAGKHIPFRSRGFRNHFCAGIGSPDHDVLMEMESLGLVKAGCVINDGKDRYYHATREGAKAAGLTKSQIARAFEK